ncbi:uncharacterized protein SCHCODRAFT_02630390 [Schizophyllum commune H4-8]|uniref:uncharacterized protein n=1 Tax=Schizophyllum commune (strain H4-8 / FGSC 9210) TaxID=578458 RepID=UPI0021605DCD|nr:uncharacterized protein SCHCODRAFT_02630390 [Schizophyllum commune H4-8]KAI5889915.1 hypothetical protein SCHCODRAFT_02630390 [Schizophyllum commune H4-8]
MRTSPHNSPPTLLSTTAPPTAASGAGLLQLPLPSLPSWLIPPPPPIQLAPTPRPLRPTPRPLLSGSPHRSPLVNVSHSTRALPHPRLLLLP